jgi:hypothetical protein
MPRLIEVQFAGYSAYLRPCQEGVRAVAPDAAGKAGTLLEEAIKQVTGSRPCYRQDDTWSVPVGELTPEVCRRILHTFQRLLQQEQRRLGDLAEALGDPRPAPPEPAHVEEEVEAEIRMPPDPEGSGCRPTRRRSSGGSARRWTACSAAARALPESGVRRS